MKLCSSDCGPHSSSCIEKQRSLEYLENLGNDPKKEFFNFHHKMLKILQNLDCKKATQQGDLLAGIIKENKFAFSQFLSQMFNFYIDNNDFPKWLKKANINLVLKKLTFLKKNNYRPISILPIISKAFERCQYDQIFEYTNSVLSNACAALVLTMIKKCRKNVDQVGSCVALLKDLSKSFDCIVHVFLTAKLEVSLTKPLQLCTVTSQTESTELKSIILSSILSIYL